MKRSLQIFTLSIIITFIFGQEGIIQKFEKDSVQIEDKELNYGIFKPENLEPDKKYPLVLALHGGEHFSVSFDEFMSSFSFKLATIWATSQVQNRNPCYILAPHLHNDNQIFWEDTIGIDFLNTIIDNIIDKGQIDTNRIYIVGHSVGGACTFKTPSLLKCKIAAIAPMSTANIWENQLNLIRQEIKQGRYRNVSVWCFHHHDDLLHPSEQIRYIFNKFEEEKYNPVYTKSFGSTIYDLSSSTIHNIIEAHQKYLYTEYNYTAADPHLVLDTASVDTLLHKWLFQQYKLDEEAITITKIDSSNSMELNWIVKNQQDEVEIWVKSDIEWILLANRKFSKNTFKIDSALENQNSSIEIIRIVVRNNKGFVYGIDEWGRLIYQTTSLITKNSAPVTFLLRQNYPNPFNPATKISYSILQPGFVSLKLYNMLGQKIKILVNEFQRTGDYTVQFDAKNLSSGIYFYRLQVDENITKAKKMLLMR